MNKIILLLLGFFLFHGVCVTKIQAQSAVSQVSVTILPILRAARVNYITNFSGTNPTTSVFSSSVPIVVSPEKGKLTSNKIQEIASFSIVSENINTFSVSLPSHPVLLTNSKNDGSFQLVDWKSSTQSGKSEFDKSSWVIKLGATLKIGEEINKKNAGVYTGSYLVTFVYN
jgi:hypothetical protein